MFLSGYLSLLPPSLGFLLLAWVFPGAPCSSMQASQHFCWLPLCWDASLLSLDQVIFEYQPVFLASSVHPGFSYESSRSQKRTKPAFLNSRIHMLCTLFSDQKILNFNISWSLQPRLSLGFAFSTQSFLVDEDKVWHYTSPYCLPYHLEKEVIINLVQEPPTLFMPCCVIPPTDTWIRLSISELMFEAALYS